jgi:SAM-dependent methyltransferase
MAMYKKILILVFASLTLGANMPLDYLEEYDKETCLGLLKTTDLADLWSSFLSLQTELYFPWEVELMTAQSFWQEAKNVLELGSGNGAYLHKLSTRFPGKDYVGVEIRPHYVEQAKQKFSGLEFREGDVEVENEEYFGLFDVILFRLTLQHLKNPRPALQHAYKYLKSGGHVIIIESYDAARGSSHDIPSLEEALRQLNEQSKESKCNRQITMEILTELQNGNGLYKIAFTSLDVQGNPLRERTRLEGLRERKLYSNLALLFLHIINRGYGVSVDFPSAYEEVKSYLEDENAWVCPGFHYFILRKI